MGERQMLPVHTKMTRKGSGEVTFPLCRSSSRSTQPEFGMSFARVVDSRHLSRIASAHPWSMLNFIVADAWSSDALWAWYSAQRAVRDAINLLDDARAVLVPLVADSEWHAKGVMALHELILDVKARTASEAGALESRIREIEMLAAS